MRRSLWTALFALCASSAVQAQILPPLTPPYSIVFDRSAGVGDFEVYNVKLDGTNEVNLTNLAGDQLWPTCSPDGKQIAFYFNGPQSDIYVMNRDGTGLVNVTSTAAFGENEREPNWSPTGKFIAYLSNINGGGIDIVAPDGTNYARVFSNSASLTASAPSVSPDGKRIAFAGSTPGVGTAIYTVRLDGTGLTQVTFPPAGFFDGHPDWSPDTKRIAFARFTGAIFDIWVARSNGSAEWPLTATADFEAFPAWSPDGRLITYCRRPGYSAPWEVWVMRSDGAFQASVGVLGQHPDFCVDKSLLKIK